MGNSFHIPKIRVDTSSSNRESIQNITECVYIANILTVLSTTFGSVTFPAVIWLCMLQPKTAIDLKLYSLMSLSVMMTVVGCDGQCHITERNVTQPTTVNWLKIFAVYIVSLKFNLFCWYAQLMKNYNFYDF